MKKQKVKFKGPKWLKVNDGKNSASTAPLNHLDWKNWWTDGNGFFGSAYLHVEHLKDEKWKKDGMADTVHRVYCKVATTAPRLGMKNGELYWLVD